MKNSLLLIIPAICVITIISCAPISQNYYENNNLQPLTVKQLKAELIGKTLHLESIEFDAFVSFKNNRTLVAKSLEGSSDSGRWSLEGDDLICMKFSSWYYGDKLCYRMIKENSQFIFFSPNGALSYTGITSSPSNRPALAKKKSQEPSNRSQLLLEVNEIHNKTVETPLEKKQRFIRLAKNCPGCNLSGVDLSDAQLNRANLAGANLSGANLANAELRLANLSGADLSGATLARANLPGADLSFANLANADFRGCNLIRANVTGAITTNINVSGAHLESIQGTIQ